MIMERFPTTGADIINSLHFADDTTIIANSIEALNTLLQVVAEWADKYHLEIHPKNLASHQEH